MDTITFHIQDELGFCTRNSDGVSGMSVTALANFCGTEQHTITQLLNKTNSQFAMDFVPLRRQQFAINSATHS